MSIYACTSEDCGSSRRKKNVEEDGEGVWDEVQKGEMVTKLIPGRKRDGILASPTAARFHQSNQITSSPCPRIFRSPLGGNARSITSPIELELHLSRH